MTDLDNSKVGVSPLLRLIAKWNAHPRRTRWISAGPLGFVMAILSMASLPHGLPAGAGGVDHLVMPVVLFPLLWAVLIVVPVLPERPGGVQAAYLGAIFLELVLIGAGMWG